MARISGVLRLALAGSAVVLVACSSTGTVTTVGKDRAPEASRSLVLVTGITGTQGGGVARALLDKGYALRGLTRDPGSDRAKAWSERGVEMVKGDFTDHASIEAALKGVDHVFVNVVERVTDYLDAAKFTIDAAHRAGVKHIVLTTNRLADPESGFEVNADRNKRVLELYLRKSGYSYTTLRIPQMMENFTRPADMQRVLTQGVVSPGKESLLNHFFSTYDMGLVTAAAFANPSKWKGREVNLSADPLTGRQVAALLSRLSGLDIKHSVVPFDQATGPTTVNARFFAEHDLAYDTVQLKKDFPQIMTLEQFLRDADYGAKLRDMAAKLPPSGGSAR